MALISIAQATEARISINQAFERDSARSYLAYFDTTDDEVAVLAGCGFALYTPHPSDATQKIIGITCDLDSAYTTAPGANTACRRWKISVAWGPWNILDFSSTGNPINLPLKFRLNFTTVPVPAFEDVDGNPICNAAGDSYDPTLEREVTHCTLTVLRNEAPSSVNLATLTALGNTTNEAEWNGFPVETVKLNPVVLPEIAYSQATSSFYYPLEYVFEINFDTWIKQVLNAGFRQLDSSGNLIPIMINGQPATVPVPLDEEGHAILTPEFKDSGGDAAPDTGGGGEDGEVDGGGEPPSGGDGVASDSNLVIDAYRMIRTSDFTALDMDSIFTLPTIV